MLFKNYVFVVIFTFLSLASFASESRACGQQREPDYFEEEPFLNSYPHNPTLYALHEKAVQGDVHAQFVLGKEFFSPSLAEVRKDYKAPAAWLTIAALHEHTQAQYFLGTLYRFGAGVK